jgi:hypothetical protein
METLAKNDKITQIFLIKNTFKIKKWLKYFIKYIVNYLKK